jgi:hypothetical protein
MENMGLFDSGGTNDSNHMQKQHFFENRYAPDEESEEVTLMP